MVVDIMEYTMCRRRITLTMFYIILVLLQYSFFYKLRIVSKLQSNFIKSTAPYLKLQPNLSILINTSEPNYPYKGAYLHETKTLCTTQTNLTLLIIVLSSTTNFKKRQILRETWTNEKYYRLYGDIKTVFLLGQDKDEDIQKKIDQEFNIYGDIVQGGFIDSYHNLTYKSTMGFRWAAERCRNAKYVLKTDDDIVINLFMLFQNNTFSETEDDYHIFCHRQIHRINRDSSKKWFVEGNQFKGLTEYPMYCGGSFILISNKVVPYFYESLKRTPFFWIEDVLLYGIALDNIQMITYKQISEIYRNIEFPRETIKCLNHRKTQCPIFITMTESDSQIKKIWNKMIEVYINQK